MASDLEKFLQQAAERLAQKVNEAADGGKSRRRVANQAHEPNFPPSSTSRPAPLARDSKIIEAQILPPTNQRELGPNPLSNLDTRPQLGQVIDQADERMSDHLHAVFDHQISNLPKPSKALNEPAGRMSNRRLQATDETTEVHQRAESVHPIANMLRRPESLKAAFIISEIFARRF